MIKASGRKERHTDELTHLVVGALGIEWVEGVAWVRLVVVRELDAFGRFDLAAYNSAKTWKQLTCTAYLSEQLNVVHSTKGGLADAHFKENCSDRPEVCLGIVLLIS